jgi:probable rRNA maturation factor
MIAVLFQTESHFPVKKAVIVAAIEQHLTNKFTSDVEVSVSIIGDRKMRNLNRSYRNLDHTTDVLSFPQNDPSQQMKPFVNVPDNVIRLGDIVVSYPEAVKEATEANTLVIDQVIFLVLHGLEHLLGNHHDE